MCRYWRKLHTCTHPSDRPYIEMCRPGFLSNTVCHDIAEDPNLRPSHFPCWTCIRATSRADAEQNRLLLDLQASTAQTAHQVAIKARQDADKKAREERVRREAREKAERERAAETKVRAEREKEAERARREGGAWMLAEAGSGKKKRGGVPESPRSPKSPSTVTASKKDARKENEGAGGGKAAWKDEKSEASGRAGVWGPKKILSRKEGAGVLVDRTDVSIGGNGSKN